MATHSSIPAWRIPMDKGTWWATVHGVAKELDTTELLNWTELNRLSPQIGLHPKNLTSHEL